MANRKTGSVELSAVDRELQKVLSNGKVLIGSNETLKAFNNKEAKVIIHASNCPVVIRRVFEDAGGNGNGELIIYEYPANSIELGLACGKPYPIASLCITDTGDSEIARILTPNVQPKEKTLRINTR
jgi:large subunit ribosomal protein L30e